MIDFKAMRDAAMISLVKHAQNPSWRNILEFLSKELGQKLAGQRALEGGEDPEGYDETWADLAFEIEDILGLAMVCCQTMFDRTISECTKLSKGDRDGLLKLGDRINADLSKANLIWALANYYKHESGWDKKLLKNMIHTGEKGTRKDKTSLQLETAKPIVAAGIDIELPYVIREGAVKLAGTLENISILAEIFDGWHNEVLRQIRDKLDQPPL